MAIFRRHLSYFCMVLVASFFVAGLASCHVGKNSQSIYYRPAMSDAYRLMIQVADRNSARDELSTLVSSQHRVTFGPSPMKDIARVAFNKTGSIAILDSSGPGIYMFSAAGSYLGSVGAIGRGPGHYRLPWSVTAKDDGFAVADFMDHRVNIYNSRGSFLTSFIYSVQRFAATGISYDKVKHSFYLFGDRQKLTKDGLSLFFVHQYKDDGTFIGSTYALPPTWRKQNYAEVDTPLLASNELQDQYFMFAFDPVLHRIDPVDFSVKDIVLTLPGFRRPPVPLPDNPGGLDTVHSWELTFTPVKSIAHYRDTTIIEYETHNGLRYTLAVFKGTNPKPTRTIATNHLLLGVDESGMALFRNNPNGTGQNMGDLTYGRLDQ